MKLKTADQFNREKGVATTGKELPSIPDTLKRVTEIEKAQETLLKKLADVDLAIAQARQETAREIFEAYDTYVKILGEEIDALVGLHIAHGGWQSPRVKDGEKCRERIERLKANYLK